jgi:hypothetical protein
MPQRPHNDDLQGVTQTEAVAAVLSVLWVAGVGVFFWYLSAESGGLRLVVTLLAMFVPVGLAWIALVSARTARLTRAEIHDLRAALDDLRARKLHAPAPPVTEATPDPATSRFASRREVSRLIVPQPAPQRLPDQPTLALGPGPEDDDPPLERPDLVRALNFPENQDDTDGFAALRRALRDRRARRLVQASQDVLTLLSQDGIYMDDLRPEPASADLWRRFAKGERGRSMDGLGAVRDHAALSLVAGRMREDTIFRDAVHHFMRRFDEILVTFEENATDTDLLEMAETRTARAFMMLGRATRTFD